MVWTKLRRYVVALCAPVLLELAMIPGMVTTAQAQTKSPSQTTGATKGRRITFAPRKNQPRPTMTVGGGVRDTSTGKCPQDVRASAQAVESPRLSPRLIPLLPTPRKDIQLTVSAHPTFLVYVPQTSAQSMEFAVLTQKNNDVNNLEEIYNTTIDLTSTPGIVSITLPDSAPQLEIGKDYKWIVSMTCEADGPSEQDPSVEGLVRRIAPDSSLSQLDQAQPLDQVAMYATSGLWYNAVANLASLRKAQPNDPEVASAWEDLLESAGLQALTPAPLRN